MNIDEIIEGLQETVDTMLHLGVCHLKLETPNIIRAAIEKLETHQDNQPNEPLTLEALRGMSGLPVWVESPGVDRELSGRWVIVDGANPDTKALFTRGGDFTCHDYGTVWVAYRRPPEEA